MGIIKLLIDKVKGLITPEGVLIDGMYYNKKTGKYYSAQYGETTKDVYDQWTWAHDVVKTFEKSIHTTRRSIVVKGEELSNLREAKRIINMHKRR